jgi:hypothetical protein
MKESCREGVANHPDRLGAGVTKSERSRAVPGATAEAAGRLRIGTPLEKNTPDPVRAPETGREMESETFDFLGFIHICGRIHKSGKFTVHRQTVGQRMAAKLRVVRVELRRRMRMPVARPGLKQIVRGYYQYHAVLGNLPRLETFRQQIARHLRFTLQRRSQRSRWTWERFETLLNHYLPRPRVLHPYALI